MEKISIQLQYLFFLCFDYFGLDLLCYKWNPERMKWSCWKRGISVKLNTVAYLSVSAYFSDFFDMYTSLIWRFNTSVVHKLSTHSLWKGEVGSWLCFTEFGVHEGWLLLHSYHSTNSSQNMIVLEWFALWATATLSHLCFPVALVRIFQAGLFGIVLKKASCLTFVVLLYFFIICWEFLHLRSYYKVNMRKQMHDLLCFERIFTCSQ